MALEYVYLLPLSDAASEVLNFDSNDKLVGRHPGSDKRALVLGPDGGNRDSTIVATAG
jgi:hypothetical protein